MIALLRTACINHSPLVTFRACIALLEADTSIYWLSLEAATRAKTGFLMIMSHELRTLLTEEREALIDTLQVLYVSTLID